MKKFIDKGTKQDDKSKTSEYRTENTANKINDNPLNKLKNKQNENKDKVDFGIFKQSTLDKDKEKLVNILIIVRNNSEKKRKMNSSVRAQKFLISLRVN